MKKFHLSTPRFQNGNISDYAEFYDSLPTSQQQRIDSVAKAIFENKKVADRESDLDRENIYTETKACGSGGVGQILVMADGKIFIQIGYGVGKYNYAKCAII